MKLNSDAEKARAMIEAVYQDGHAEIHGRKYVLTTYTHKERRKVFAYFTRVKDQLQAGDFSFLDAPDFQPVEELIANHALFNDARLGTLGNHWDLYPGDYVPFITTSLMVVSYPFMAGAGTA